MKHPSVLLAVSALIAGLFWSLASDVNVVLIHFVFPVVWGIAIAFLISSTAFARRCGTLIATVLLAETLRLIICGSTAGRWYVTSEGETQLVILLSLAVQLAVAVASLAITHFIRRKRHAA